MSETADFSEDDQGGTRRLAFSGRLTLARIDELPARLATLPADRDYALHLPGVERMDPLGALLIHRFGRDRARRLTLAGPNANLLSALAPPGRCHPHTQIR